MNRKHNRNLVIPAVNSQGIKVLSWNKIGKGFKKQTESLQANSWIDNKKNFILSGIVGITGKRCCTEKKTHIISFGWYCIIDRKLEV